MAGEQEEATRGVLVGPNLAPPTPNRPRPKRDEGRGSKGGATVQPRLQRLKPGDLSCNTRLWRLCVLFTCTVLSSLLSVQPDVKAPEARDPTMAHFHVGMHFLFVTGSRGGRIRLVQNPVALYCCGLLRLHPHY